MNPGLILAAATVAFIVATIFMFALRPVAFAIGLVDAPGGRKFHEGHIPIIGGVAMFAGIFAAASALQAPDGLMPSIFVASLILVVVGALDDRFHLPASARLLTQFVAILLMYFGAGLGLTDIGNPFATGTVHTGQFALVVTMLVFISMINAYNFVDGADGLAGSLSLIGMLAITLVAGAFHPTGAFALAVAAAITGFLLFNFPTPYNRKVLSFMGDAGSTLLGFTIAWVTLSISSGPDKLISPVHCLWFAAVPIFDFFACFVRRLLKRKSPFRPGRDHFHHILLRGGFGVRQTLGILTGLQAIYALIGLGGYFAAIPDVFMFWAWAALGTTQVVVLRFIARHYRSSRRRRRRPQTTID